MAAAERITFADFQERFKTEEQCREYLFRQRFPNGFVCPSCGAKEYYPIYRRNLCQCKKCRNQTSVTVGCHCVVQSFRERNSDVSSDAGGS